MPTNVPGIFLSIPSFVLLLEPHSPTIWSHLQAGPGPQATPCSAQPGRFSPSRSPIRSLRGISVLCPGRSACHLIPAVCPAPLTAVLDVHTGGAPVFAVSDGKQSKAGEGTLLMTLVGWVPVSIPIPL